MTNHCTHIIQNFESKNQSVLSRKSDGMVIAIRAGQTVAWGEDPRQQQQRIFTDPKFAQTCLRKIADADQCVAVEQPDAKATIEEVEGESRLVSPALFKGMTQ